VSRRRRRPAKGPRYTADLDRPGAFEGETVTRRRLVTGGALAAGGIATAAIGLPSLGFALGPVLEQQEPTRWQDVGSTADFSPSVYVPATIMLVPDVGEAGQTTVYVRKRDPAVDVEPADRWNQYIALTTRCSHVGCPVRFVQAAGNFICPCHGGVYDFRGLRIGGPPPRPLDRFFTRTVGDRVQLGPRYSVDSHLRRFAPRDPSEPLDGFWQYLYPRRLTPTPKPR
jgi:menaquinol-cytochrome c reductase iron-sulfur subunit